MTLAESHFVEADMASRLPTLVAQWTEHTPAKRKMWVRVPPGVFDLAGVRMYPEVSGRMLLSYRRALGFGPGLFFSLDKPASKGAYFGHLLDAPVRRPKNVPHADLAIFRPDFAAGSPPGSLTGAAKKPSNIESRENSRAKSPGFLVCFSSGNKYNVIQLLQHVHNFLKSVRRKARGFFLPVAASFCIFISACRRAELNVQTYVGDIPASHVLDVPLFKPSKHQIQIYLCHPNGAESAIAKPAAPDEADFVYTGDNKGRVVFKNVPKGVTLCIVAVHEKI